MPLSYDFNQSGPETHVLSAKIAGDVPRDAMSAGLSLLEQCLQASGGTRLLISHTLFYKTNCFHSRSSPRIQYSATSESDQHLT